VFPSPFSSFCLQDGKLNMVLDAVNSLAAFESDARQQLNISHREIFQSDELQIALCCI